MKKHPAQAAIERLPHLHGHSGHWQFDLYPIRADIAAIVKPCRIFEFGAYLGWALIAFAIGAGDELRAIGWADDERDCPDSNRLCRENLRAAPMPPRVRVAHWRSSLDALRFRQADLVAVDGDHSYDGCMRDLITAWRLRPQVIVVDDMHAIPDVTQATVNFARWIGAPCHYLRTENGIGLIDIAPNGLPEHLLQLGYTVEPLPA